MPSKARKRVSVTLPRIDDFGVCLNLSIENVKHLPNCPAVYIAYVPETAQVLYIGKTRWLRDRWRHKGSHWQIKHVCKRAVRVAWFPLRDLDQIHELELIMIHQYQPMFNEKGTDPRQKTYEIL